MVQLVFLLDPTQDRDGIGDAWLFDLDRLKAPSKGGIFFDIFAILIQRGRSDAVQFAAGQSRFDQIGRVHRTIAFARADKRVHLIDEQ